MNLDLAIISQYAVPAIEIMLIAALFWVAGIFMVLDKKLNAMKKGTDGIKDTIAELNGAIERAQSAVLALKNNTNAANLELEKRIEEAKAAGEALKFLTTAQKAINSAPKATHNNDLTTMSQYNGRRRTNLEDLPPLDPQKRNIWGGLR